MLGREATRAESLDGSTETTTACVTIVIPSEAKASSPVGCPTPHQWQHASVKGPRCTLLQSLRDPLPRPGRGRSAAAVMAAGRRRVASPAEAREQPTCRHGSVGLSARARARGPGRPCHADLDRAAPRRPPSSRMARPAHVALSSCRSFAILPGNQAFAHHSFRCRVGVTATNTGTSRRRTQKHKRLSCKIHTRARGLQGEVWVHTRPLHLVTLFLREGFAFRLLNELLFLPKLL